MRIQLSQKDDHFNTEYAPLAALLAHYQQNQVLQPMGLIDINMKSRVYTPISKLEQVLISMLAGCEYLVEVNSKLQTEPNLAQVWQLEQFAEQSTLARTLDGLTLMNSHQLQQASQVIWRSQSQTRQHDWRGHLWLDFDLSGLPCGKQAQESSRGYFSGEKTLWDVN